MLTGAFQGCPELAFFRLGETAASGSESKSLVALPSKSNLLSRFTMHGLPDLAEEATYPTIAGMFKIEKNCLPAVLAAKPSTHHSTKVAGQSLDGRM